MKGKTILVTGASRGIGQAIASDLGAAGGIIIGTATTEKGVQCIEQQFAEKKIQGAAFCLDIADDQSVNDFFSQVNAQYEAPQILINNAGITRDNLLLRMKSQEWTDVINTNLSGLYRMTKTCLKGMTKARWGRIINISSVIASSGNIGQANYASSKAGMEGFTRSLAMEIGIRNITVNAIAPGFIETDMTRDLSEENKARAIMNIPLKRMGSPEDIAAAVHFLASDAAAYITGEILHVNGGLYMS
ncbi:MAG: 3-oxoacyl-ACP reductase FabG [Endozoicomonadaceae bacterium]|nr:3-oxoacyl-ACP reductase FabG [Endozoicomonadaceae bacterium]